MDVKFVFSTAIQSCQYLLSKYNSHYWKFNNNFWGKKITCPGRTSIYFHPMSGGQVKNSVQVYLTIYISDKLIDNRTSKNLTYLARGTSENSKIVLPLRLLPISENQYCFLNKFRMIILLLMHVFIFTNIGYSLFRKSFMSNGIASYK